MVTRRTDGEGTPEQLPSGKWRYRGWQGSDRVSSRSFESKKAAYDDFKRAVKEAKKKSAEAAILPVAPDDSRLPLADYCQKVLDGPYRKRVKQRKLAPRTWDLYESIVANHLDGSYLGEMPMMEVGHTHIEEWMEGLTVAAKADAQGNVVKPARPMGNASKVRYAVFLSGVYEHARKVDKIVKINPVRDAEKPEIDPDDVDFRILSLEEVGRLFECLRKWEEWQDGSARPNAGPRPDHVRGRTILAAQLGLHGFGPSEILGMTKEDLSDGGLTPKRQGQRGQLVPWLKTKRRRKWVPIDDELLAMVEAAPPGLLIRTDAEGKKPVGENNLRRTFHGALKDTEFAGLTPYDLRHTFAMRLLEEDTDVQTAAELMRHSTEVFLRRYVRSREDLKRSAVRRAQRGKPDQPTHETNPQLRIAA